MNRICVFCGSSVGARPDYAAAARAAGRTFAERGIGLVYGGGNVGLMGALADGALAAGGEVIGVIPAHLAARELAHPGASEMHVVGSMHERKALMFALSDALIALPGGLGTFEELIEVLTWAQLGLHQKPIGLLDVARYYEPLIALLDHAVAEGFVALEHRSMLVVESDVEALLAALEGHEPTAVPKWIELEET